MLTFTVKDSDGDAVAGVVVTFTMTGPNGGESISPSTDISSSAGVVSTTVSSGYVAGPVTITASTVVGSTTISSSPAPVSIGGGIPSSTHFSLAASTLNLQGLVTYNVQSTISAYIADRFGNYNVLTGTSINFYTEAGAIDTSVVTADGTGTASVTFRTQAPSPEDVAVDATDTAYINAVNATYGTAIAADGSDGQPRDGWLNILATVQGEERFIDANANGVYDTGETFAPYDLGEPFIDADDDGTWDAGEFYVDSDDSGTYTTANGVWDGPNCPGAGCETSKMIWDDITLAFTGNATRCYVTPSTSQTITNGTSVTYTFMVSDVNLNPPIAGTTITVALSGGGELLGASTYTVPDSVTSGPYEISVIVNDNDTDTTAAAYSLKFTVASSSIVACSPVTVTGSVQ